MFMEKSLKTWTLKAETPEGIWVWFMYVTPGFTVLRVSNTASFVLWGKVELERFRWWKVPGNTNTAGSGTASHCSCLQKGSYLGAAPHACPSPARSLNGTACGQRSLHLQAPCQWGQRHPRYCTENTGLAEASTGHRQPTASMQDCRGVFRTVVPVLALAYVCGSDRLALDSVLITCWWLYRVRK